jgi:DeoR family transcriptional regulator, fructose operon transcriptional repressor
MAVRRDPLTSPPPTPGTTLPTMARAAVELVCPGDTVLIDMGTGASEVARALPTAWTGRVLTNSLPAVAALAERPGVEVILSGGRVEAGELACLGRQALALFADYHADVAFLGAGGVHMRAGLVSGRPHPAGLRRVALDHAVRGYVLLEAGQSPPRGLIGPAQVYILPGMSTTNSTGTGRRQLAAERQGAIAAMVAAQPSVKTNELAAELGVSVETIRRDLLRLEQLGLIERVHGGATARQRPPAMQGAYGRRRSANVAAKRAMARAAVELVRPGDTIVIDASTSALEVARALPGAWTGRVLTNSLPAAAELADRPDVEILLSGGLVQAGDLACSGSQVLTFFADYYADAAFLGAGGVHATAGLTSGDPQQVDVQRVVLDHAGHAYVLADASKLGVIAVRRVCGLDRVTGLITDGTPDQELATALDTANVQVIGSDVNEAATAG